MQLIAMNTIRGLKEDGSDIHAGEVFTAGAEEAVRLIELGAAEEVGEEELFDDESDKAKELARIAAAKSLDELGVLPEEETDQEIVEAFQKRHKELDEPDH